MLILRVQRAQKEQRKQRQQREQRQQKQPREVEECQKRYFVVNTFNVVRCYLCCSSMLKSKNRTHLSLPPLQNPDPSAFKEMDHTEPCSCTSNSCNTSPLATLTNTRRPSLVPEERLKDGTEERQKHETKLNQPNQTNQPNRTNNKPNTNNPQQPTLSTPVTYHRPHVGPPTQTPRTTRIQFPSI